jgi:Fe-S-cluster containining protein
MTRHFSCTACGKCCFGWVPLTIPEAIAHAGRFPLAVVWSPVRARPGREPAGGLGLLVPVGPGRLLPVRIAPTAYIPPSHRCPELGDDGLCAIHAEKPIRCRTMPFIGWRDEDDQGDLLVPRPGWSCDTGGAAPAVYADGRILERGDWLAERAALAADQPAIRRHAQAVLAAAPHLPQALAAAAAQAGGSVVMGFGPLLRGLTGIDAADLAGRQGPVLADFAARTAADPALSDYHTRYRNWAADLARLGETA